MGGGGSDRGKSRPKPPCTDLGTLAAASGSIATRSESSDRAKAGRLGRKPWRRGRSWMREPNSWSLPRRTLPNTEEEASSGAAAALAPIPTKSGKMTLRTLSSRSSPACPASPGRASRALPCPLGHGHGSCGLALDDLGLVPERGGLRDGPQLDHTEPPLAVVSVGKNLLLLAGGAPSLASRPRLGRGGRAGLRGQGLG